VTVSALGTSELAAHVVAVDATGTSSSSVVEYNVTFALDRSEPNLKAGMTSTVAVTVSERDNVLHVPSAAVTGSGSNARVTVVKNGTQTVTRVVAGLKGDSSTQIVSGVTAGESVVTSTGVVATSASTGTSTTSSRTSRFGGGGFTGGGSFGGGSFGGGAGGP
jgi:multidrug efflux pump subunit AcrA (membrane-fusion protein)